MAATNISVEFDIKGLDKDTLPFIQKHISEALYKYGLLVYPTEITIKGEK